LWGNRDFVKLWVGQTVSELGSGITSQALPFTALLVLAATPAQMGLLAAVAQLPVLLFSLLAGVWVDRLRRRSLLIAADLGRALLLGSVPLAWALGLLRLEQLFLVAGLVGILSLFFNVAYRSYLPVLVKRDQLVEGNSKLSASGSVADMGGVALGGILVQWLSAPIAILFDVVSFVCSALAVGFIRTPEPPKVVEEQENVRQEIAEGLRLVLGNRVLRALAGSSGTFAFFGNFFHALYVLYAVRELGIPPAIVGVLIGAGGVGAFVGALLVGRVTRRFGLGATLMGTLIFEALVQMPILLAGGSLPVSIAILMATQLVGDVAISIYLISEVSLRQAIVPDRLLGRANASTGFLVGGLGPVGALLGGALGEAIGARWTLLIAMLGMMGIAPLWLFFSPVRSMREQPGAPQEQALDLQSY
jgi:MFS family permease